MEKSYRDYLQNSGITNAVFKKIYNTLSHRNNVRFGCVIP